ncbi:PREDICTED: biogenesis of lysosome-related organelles complex 1 subunit 5-like [Priapulus caudatus]|uniref:Biogenesis of lysosome-related organelles complex 1 subunit 5 n=1 Tax=Priapulus caudatus TaxID=37621 RepID=A0ABM1EMY6_PRICU|nr:PREDICTED: biogenesis of lysosome-related organelles complex 1 subunit 5-like [Priapulus caudatus]
MASIENIVKDTGEIYSRLFDHRPVIQAEIKYFVREFETKRNDREEKSRPIKEVHNCILQTQACAEDIASAAVDIPSLTERIRLLAGECRHLGAQQYRVTPPEEQRQQQERRACEWRKFREDMEQWQTQLEQQSIEEEKKFRQYYADLEDKLKLGLYTPGTKQPFDG